MNIVLIYLPRICSLAKRCPMPCTSVKDVHGRYRLHSHPLWEKVQVKLVSSVDHTSKDC